MTLSGAVFMTLLLLLRPRGGGPQFSADAINTYVRAAVREHKVSGPGDRIVRAAVRETRIKRLA